MARHGQARRGTGLIRFPGSRCSRLKCASVPLNRLVAFLGPVVSIIAGVIADWLLAVPRGPDVLGVFGVTDQTAITAWLTQALVFALTAILVWLGQQKWLSGWINWEMSHDFDGTPVVNPPPTEPPPVNPATKLPSTKP